MKSRFAMILACCGALTLGLGCDDDPKGNNANNVNNVNNVNNTNNVNNVNNVNNANNANNVNNVNNLPGATRNVDVVLVVDTSMSMADEQVVLQQNLPTLLAPLRQITGGLPNLHVGTLTPDLGAAPFNLPGCEAGGDGGRFLKGEANACTNPSNQSFVVDVEPRGCTIEKDTGTDGPATCLSHTCEQTHCDAAAFSDGLGGDPTEPDGLTLFEDAHGCPRCRNYADETLDEVVACMAGLGTGGCGFEQPLEALMTALDAPPEDNLGFLRDDALLVVILVTDEDDCSASNPELFNPEGDLASPLGPISSFRCTEFGVVCDEPWQRVMADPPATHTNCVPRPADDPMAMLHPVERYTTFLETLKGSGAVITAVIAGPYDNTLQVDLDEMNKPFLLPSCGTLDANNAQPAVRLRHFVNLLTPVTADLEWAFYPICSADFTSALTGVAEKVRAALEAAAQ